MSKPQRLWSGDVRQRSRLGELRIWWQVRETFRDQALILAVKAAVGGLVLWTGFSAVSDDDFARVVLAQRWASDPKLDATGTSWLPLPFWVFGGAMKLFGPSLAVAKAVAFALGLLAVLIIYRSAHLVFASRHEALAATFVAVIFPWCARLGVATVPELPTAALGVYATATVSRSDARHRIAGGLALLAASWCRYEPWIIGACFVGLCAYDAWRSRERRTNLIAVAIAICGPLAWLVNNAIVHGEAFHFLGRVSDYQRALGGEQVWALGAYAMALLREEPELALMTLLLFVLTRRSGQPFWGRSRRIPFVMLALLAALSLAGMKGGAPTHHAGRALLFIWLFMAMFVGAVFWRRFSESKSSYRGALLGAVLGIALLGGTILRPWYGRIGQFAQRSAEVAIGLKIGQLLPPSRSVLLEVRDYGYFAIQAASGKPEAFVLDRVIDPRAKKSASSFRSGVTLEMRAKSAGAAYVVGHRSGVTMSLGSPILCRVPWCLWKLERAE